MQTANLAEAYAGSFYTISGAGAPLEDWEAGMNGLLEQNEIGKPSAWFQTTGRDVNKFAAARGTVTNPFQDDLTIIMFPLTGLAGAKLSIFKVMAGDRWFDDLVDNMIERADMDEHDG
jgi:hypothetical protein